MRIRFPAVVCVLAMIAPVSLVAQQKDLRLLEAVKRRDQRAFTSLLKAKADINAAQPDGATALAWAIHLGERSMVEALLTAGARANTVDEYGESPLTLAAANGDLLQRFRGWRRSQQRPLERRNGAHDCRCRQRRICSPAGYRGADANVADPRRGRR
jgi:hypothetical protein